MATYKKPNIRYTDMCIYIDKTVYTDECDDVKIFEYLYHLINMLAHQGSYFNSAHYYDDFALTGATRVLLRLKNPKQFIMGPDGQPLLTPIKSVLNYIKSIIYPMKVNFEQETYAQVSAHYTKNGMEYNFDGGEDFKAQLSEQIDDIKLSDFNLYFQDVAKTCRSFMNKIPRSLYTSEWTNIYTSVLLTLLNSVTLNNKNKEKIKQLGNVIYSKPEVIDKVYKEEQADPVILFHLDEEYRNYVFVLYNRLRHLIAKDLSNSAHTFIPSEINAKNLLMASLEEEESI